MNEYEMSNLFMSVVICQQDWVSVLQGQHFEKKNEMSKRE